MNVGKALLMGLIQGLTEFLPVSSSGHLALLKQLFKLDTDAGILFDVLLHIATLAAICIVYFKDVARIVTEFFGICADVAYNISTFFRTIGNPDSSKYKPIITSSYRKFTVMVIISTIPTAILGMLLQDVAEYSGSSLLVTGICLIGTGAVVLIADLMEGGEKKPKTATLPDAFCVGVAQGISTLPGLSRAGSTIAAGMLCGFDKRFAVKYSYIMSVPAILGALIIELFNIPNITVSGADFGCYFLGMIVAAVVGFFALNVVMRLALSRYFKYFSFYCFGIGFISLIVFLISLAR